MSEWIKFDFDMKSETTACDLVMYLDDAQVQSVRISASPIIDDGEHPEKRATLWIEIDDDAAHATANHTIRINVVERLNEDGNPIYEYPMVELSAIELSGSAHTPADGNINDSMKVYNILDPDYQALIDAGDAKHDSQVTEDIGNGFVTYSVSNWDDYLVIGNGCWKLEFQCPYLTWYDAIHAD
jgi:hypothetical protein